MIKYERIEEKPKTDRSLLFFLKSWEFKVPPQSYPPANKALLRDY